MSGGPSRERTPLEPCLTAEGVLEHGSRLVVPAPFESAEADDLPAVVESTLTSDVEETRPCSI